MTNKKELDYTRLQALLKNVQSFVDDNLPKEIDDTNGFEFLLFAHDVANGAVGTCILLNQKDQRESLVQCIDKCITGKALKGAKESPQEWEILNGIAEYIIRLCAQFPELYKNFQRGVEKYMNENHEPRTE